MRTLKLLVIVALSIAVLSSCKKDHYNMGNVNGINAEGEVLLPLVSTSTTMMDLMESFKIDSVISCNDDGSLYYGLFYDAPNVVNGNELLRFKDLNDSLHFDLTNILQFAIPNIFDTVVKFDLPLHFESDYIDVKEAWMRSGHFDFVVSSNVGILQGIVVRSSDIKDANGNDMEFFFDTNGSFDFDIGGLHYKTEVANSVTLSIEMHLAFTWNEDPNLYLDIDINGRDLCLREMRGIVNPYVVPGVIDTTFNIFPSNVSGQLEVYDARLRIAERNFFNIDAELRVDTALVYSNDVESYSLLEPLPFIVPIRTQMTMEEVRNQKFDATIQAYGGRARIAYYFTLNPHGTAEASVADTCSIDVQIGVDIPFSFNASDVRYIDTVEISLNELEMPDMIESIILDLDIASTLPLNLNGLFYLYDSQTDIITDTLNSNGNLIMASFNEQPVSTKVSVEINKDRLDKLFHSDRIIMEFEVDTDARDVKLSAQQKLDLLAKAKVKYNGDIELKKTN